MKKNEKRKGRQRTFSLSFYFPQFFRSTLYNMGNFKSKPASVMDSSSGSSSISRAIDKQIKVDQKRMKKEVKLLLLGKIRLIMGSPSYCLLMVNHYY
jgi:hypothetical protein